MRSQIRNGTVVLIVTLLISVLSGCVAPPPAATPPGPEATSAAPGPMEPVMGGTYITAYGSAGSAYTIGPVPYGHGLQAIHWQFVYNALAELGEDAATWTPALAESWETSADGLTVTFHLRDGVTWHDGEPFTAADVVYSLQAWLSVTDAWFGSPLADMIQGAADFHAATATDIPGAVAVDDLTVQFTLTNPLPDGSFMVAINSQPILAKHQWEGQIEQGMTLDELGQLPAMTYPVGTGPFKISNYNPEEVIEYEKNPSYFRGEPYLDRIVMRLFKDEIPIATGLESGEIISAAVWTKDHWPRLFQLETIRTWVDPVLGGIFRLDTNLRPEKPDSPLHDVRFRKAILYAIPRQTIADTVRLGVSQPAMNLVNNPNYLNGLSLTEFGYDPDMARYLLTEMGYDSATAPALILTTTAFDNGPELTGIQQALGEVGIRLEISVVERAARPDVWADMNAWDLHYQYQTTPGTDDSVASTLESFKGCLLPLGECGWSGSVTWQQPERYDQILAQQGTELDGGARKALLQEAIVILDEEVPLLHLWTEPNTYFINARVHGEGNGVYRYGAFSGMPNMQTETWWISP